MLTAVKDELSEKEGNQKQIDQLHRTRDKLEAVSDNLYAVFTGDVKNYYVTDCLHPRCQGHLTNFATDARTTRYTLEARIRELRTELRDEKRSKLI